MADKQGKSNTDFELESLSDPRADQVLEKTAAELADGRLCLFPCDTIYGIIARCDDAGARRLIDFKKRPPDKPFICLAPSLESLQNGTTDSLVSELNQYQRFLCESLWPGPVTLILPTGHGFGYLAEAPGGLAVRLPEPGSLIARLLEKTGFALWAPSANVSGQPYRPDLIDFRIAWEQLPAEIQGSWVNMPLPGAEPSVLLDISRAQAPGDVQVLRGQIDAARLQMP